ncbi:MAG: HEAT repeat domain-containing protein [Waddliaceae bacterium]
MKVDPLNDVITNEILMHRDAHFGGRFPTMIEYYQKEGKGINPAFSIHRIVELAEIEKTMNQDLSTVVLSGPDAEKVGKVRSMYKSLRELYEKKLESDLPRLIADLILSEEEEPTEEMQAIINRRSEIVPSLVTLLHTNELYDPLFPGYGLAPEYAAKCLGQIGDKRALFTLFENLGKSDFFHESRLIDAIYAIGQPAKDFLLKILRARPITNDTERAAVALIAFKDDEEIANACLELLKQPDVHQYPVLATYLILGCEGLTDPGHRMDLIHLTSMKSFPDILLPDVKHIEKMWGH